MSAAEALEAVRKSLAASMVRTRMHADALDDIERLVAQLELACIRHVREAVDRAYERAAEIAAEEGDYHTAVSIRDLKFADDRSKDKL